MDITADYQSEYESLKELLVNHKIDGTLQNKKRDKMAFTGIILKLFFTGRYNLISTLMYVLMGWLIVFAIKPLINNLPSGGLLWLFTGGISYTIGALVYSIKKINFNHAIFHMFVLVGSFCHFMALFFYVLPTKLIPEF